jgi:hypothetical protein
MVDRKVSYQEIIERVALNDDGSIGYALAVLELVADLFEVDQKNVAADIRRYHHEHPSETAAARAQRPQTTGLRAAPSVGEACRQDGRLPVSTRQRFRPPLARGG